MARAEEKLKPLAAVSRKNMRIYHSEELFCSESAIQINHRGVIYTLRITQFGKLILTK